LVLTEYEKEENKKKKGASALKGFKYPPVLPIVYYDGTGNWTAETEFLNKVELNNVFYKYIPKFEYEVVSLKQYTVEDLIRFGDALSLIMIIDKISKPDEINLLGKLPPNYIETLKLNIPPHLNKLLADVITVLLKRINVPTDEINAVTEQIYERGLQEMFNIENYDVQETRRVAEARGIAIGEERGIAIGEERGMAIGEERGMAIGEERGMAIGEERGMAIGRVRGIDSGLDISSEILRSLIEKAPIDEIAERYNVSIDKVKKIQSVLAQMPS